MELLDCFIDPLAEELGVPPFRKAGLSHAITGPSSYMKRIAAINFAMYNDDGMHHGELPTGRPYTNRECPALVRPPPVSISPCTLA